MMRKSLSPRDTSTKVGEERTINLQISLDRRVNRLSFSNFRRCPRAVPVALTVPSSIFLIHWLWDR